MGSVASQLSTSCSLSIQSYLYISGSHFSDSGLAFFSNFFYRVKSLCSEFGPTVTLAFCSANIFGLEPTFFLKVDNWSFFAL